MVHPLVHSIGQSLCGCIWLSEDIPKQLMTMVMTVTMVMVMMVMIVVVVMVVVLTISEW